MEIGAVQSFKNVFIAFNGPQNVVIDTKIMLISQLEVINEGK